VHNGSAPAAIFGVVEAEREDVWMFRQYRMHPLAKLSGAFPMDDSQLENPALPARFEVITHQLTHFTRIERVQIQHPINRQLNRFVHSTYRDCFCSLVF
jgi:hypothetical protein